MMIYKNSRTMVSSPDGDIDYFYIVTRVVFWPSTRAIMPFQSDAPEGSDTTQWLVIERNRVGGIWLMKWDKEKNPMVHS